MNNNYSSYAMNYGISTTPLLEITPGKNCRMYPYIKGQGCNQAINQCKSNLATGFPAQIYQGMPVHFKYNLACDMTRENYHSPSAKYCTTSVNTKNRTCSCNQGSIM